MGQLGRFFLDLEPHRVRQNQAFRIWGIQEYDDPAFLSDGGQPVGFPVYIDFLGRTLGMVPAQLVEELAEFEIRKQLLKAGGVDNHLECGGQFYLGIDGNLRYSV